MGYIPTIMAWWVWMLLGFILLVGEVLTPGGLVLLFFGISALAVGIFSGAFSATDFSLQALSFSLLSIVSLLTLRKPVLHYIEKWTGQSKAVDMMVGTVGVALEDLPVQGMGKVEYRGTPWTARNVGNSTLAKGARCVVERVEGLTIMVRAE